MKLIEKGFFKRNKKIIIIAVAIMFLSAVAGCAISSIYAGDDIKGKVTEGLLNVSHNQTDNVKSGSIFGVDLTFACVSVLPHAIIEYFAGAIALAAAFLVTKLEINAIKNRSIRGTLEESKVELNDLLTFIILVVVLLAIAAFIEGNITPMITRSFFGL